MTEPRTYSLLLVYNELEKTRNASQARYTLPWRINYLFPLSSQRSESWKLEFVTSETMNNPGHQPVSATVKSFWNKVFGSSRVFVHEYEFDKRSQGLNQSTEDFCNDLQSVLNKWPNNGIDVRSWQECPACEDRILLATLVAGIKSNDVCKGPLCFKYHTLEKAVQRIEVDKAMTSQVDKFSLKVDKNGASTCEKGKSRWSLVVLQSGKDCCLIKSSAWNSMF